MTGDVDVHGRTVRAGDTVVAWCASADGNERVLAEPYRVLPRTASTA